MTTIIAMAIFGLVTGFLTTWAGHGLLIGSRRDSHLKGIAAGGLMLLVIILGVAVVWPLMKGDVRQWVLSYVLAYAAGMLAASYRRVDRTDAPFTKPPHPAWQRIHVAPKLLVAVLLLAGPSYLVVTGFTPQAGPLVALIGMVAVLVLTVWLQRVRCPACGGKFFRSGAYWNNRCASCGARRDPHTSTTHKAGHQSDQR